MKITCHQASFLFVVFSMVSVVYQLPSGTHALGDSQVCCSSAGFPVIVLWSSQATQGCGHNFHFITVPVCVFRGYLSSCYGSLFCPPWVTIAAISPLSVAPELWLLTACQRHILCPWHLYPITPAGATCSCTLPASPPLPSLLAMICQEEEGLLLIKWLLPGSHTTTQWHLGNTKSPVLETGSILHHSQGH